jgi:site-specific recombinase XerD
MTRRLPRYVHGFIDRHGKARHYIRRPGFKQVALPGLPFSAEFMTAYAAALDGEAAPRIEIGASRTIPGTVNAIVAAYLASPPFRAGAAATQKMRRNILDGFRTQHGDKQLYHIRNGQRVMLLTAEHLQRIVNEKSETPFQQRNILNSLRVMFAWAKSEGRIPDNPTIGVERMKVKTRGYPTWSEAEIERFEARYPIGTRERLALALLLYTGQRKGDVIRLGPTHIHRGMWMIDQGKTEGKHAHRRKGRKRCMTAPGARAATAGRTPGATVV